MAACMGQYMIVVFPKYSWRNLLTSVRQGAGRDPFAAQLRTVREIIVVDRSAIQRSDRGAISDNATVNSRTVLSHRSDPLV